MIYTLSSSASTRSAKAPYSVVIIRGHVSSDNCHLTCTCQIEQVLTTTSRSNAASRIELLLMRACGLRVNATIGIRTSEPCITTEHSNIQGLVTLVVQPRLFSFLAFILAPTVTTTATAIMIILSAERCCESRVRSLPRPCPCSPW